VRKRRWIMLVTLAAVLIGGVAFAWWTRPPRVTWQNCERVKLGMSRAEVEAILGPPGDYRSGETDAVSVPDPDALSLSEATGDAADFSSSERWESDVASLSLFFDASGRVTRKDYTRQHLEDQSPLDNLRWQADRLWRPAHRWLRQLVPKPRKAELEVAPAGRRSP
jgi:hypothetical protein